MKSIKTQIEELKKIDLESFDIDVLIVMQSEIKIKQDKLSKRIEKLKQAIEGAAIYKDFYGETNLLPDQFTAPLRRIVSKQREVQDINKFYTRYEEELLRLENIIQRKKLDQIQNKIFGFSNFTKIKDFIIAFLIIVVIGLLFFELLPQYDSYEMKLNIFIIDAICCFIFQLNFWLEFYLSKSKKWYLKNHWIDFITSIPIPSYELVRSGRLIRLFRLLRVLRLLRVFKVFKLVSFVWRGMSTLSEVFDVKLMKKTFIYSLSLLIIGAFIISYIEHNNSQINSYQESLWWSFNAIVTGGFADIYNPKTIAGMFVTTILVFVGMVLVSVFTATLTSLMVGDESDQSADGLKLYVEKRLNKIDNRIDELIKKIDSKKND